MKKIYQIPEVIVTCVIMEHALLQMSDPQATVNPDGNVDAANIESRGSSVWDDELEDY